MYTRLTEQACEELPRYGMGMLSFNCRDLLHMAVGNYELVIKKTQNLTAVDLLQDQGLHYEARK